MKAADRVSFTTATTGTGTVTVAAAVSGFQDIASSALVDGDEVTYGAKDGTAWETGSGIVGGSGTTLTRVLDDSSTGSLLSLSGSAVFSIAPTAKRTVLREASGDIRSDTNAGANECTVPLTNYLYQVADRTLTNSTAEQQIFDQTTNGALTLPAGVYQFDCFFHMTTMSATSGNASFDILGAGTATVDRVAYTSYGSDAGAQLGVGNVSGIGSVTVQHSGSSVVSPATGSGMRVRVQGMFRVTAAGTIIPSTALVTAAAAVLKAGSNIIIKKIGESSEATVGDWS